MCVPRADAVVRAIPRVAQLALDRAAVVSALAEMYAVPPEIAAQALR